MPGTTIKDKCKRGHPWVAKTTRWIMVKGYMRRKCRICESEGLRLKYKNDLAYRDSKRAYNLNYYREKVALRNAV